MGGERVACGAIVALHLASLVVAPPIPVNVIVTATGLVYVGAARSLAALRTGAKSASGRPVKSEDALTLTTRDAAQFPLVGSCALCAARVRPGLFFSFSDVREARRVGTRS